MAETLTIRVGLDNSEAQRAARELGNIVESSFTRSRDALGRFTKQGRDALEVVTQSARQMGAQVETAVARPRDAWGRFSRQGKAALETVSSSASATGKQVEAAFTGSFFSRFTERAKAAFSAIRSSASGLFDGLGGGGGGGGIGSLLGGAGGVLGGALSVFGGGALLGAVTGGLGAVAGGLKSVISSGVDFNATIESAQISLKRLLGSSTAASEEIQKLKKEALSAPVTFETLLELDQRLIAVGFSAKTTANDLTKFAQGLGLIAGTKGLDDRMGRIVTQLAQMATKGRAANEELTVLAENNIPAYKLLAEATGKTTDEIFKLAEAGQLRGLETAQLLFKQIGEQARQAGPEIQKSFAVLSSNLADLQQQASGQATENIFGSIKKGLEALTGPGAQGLAQSLASGVNDITKPLTDAFDKLVSGVQSGNFFAAAKEVGGAVTDSLKEGLTSKSDSLDQAVYDQAVGILRTVKDALGIDSPSKKMIELGEFSGEGYRVGLLSKKDEIQAALREIVDVDAVVAGVKEQLGGKRQKISPRQEENLRSVLDTILQDATLNTKEINVALKQVAYLLATIKHETANTFEAIRERRADPTRQPGVAAQQSRYFDTGFFGRGFVQLTHEDNYRRLGQRIGLGNALVSDPDLALRTDIAAQIALTGSQEGLFRRDGRGRRFTLDRFINEDRTDFFGARNVINGGNDRASQIAGIANTFFDILNNSRRQPGGSSPAAAVATVDARPAQQMQTALRAVAETLPQITVEAKLVAPPLQTAGQAALAIKPPAQASAAAVEQLATATNQASDQAAAFHKIWKDPLEDDIKKVRVEIEQIGTNLESKAALVQLQAIRDLAKADEDAVLGQIRSRVELADKTIFHSARSNAAVLEHLNQQTRSVTDLVSDVKIGLIDKVLSAADSGIAKLTERLGFFRDIIAQVLSGLARMLLNRAFQAIFGLNGGGGGAAQPAAGGGGFNLGGLLGGLLGGGGGFFTGGFAGGPGAGSVLGGSNNLFGSLSSLFGSNSIQAAPSISRIGNFPIVGNLPVPLLGGGSNASGGILGALGLGNLRNLLGGFGFGRPAGSGGALASLAPLLGLSLGSGLGGQSTLGRILGGAGGLLAGVGLTAAPAALGSLGLGALAPLFSNPVTAIAGAALLPIAFLFSRAQQRRRDEEQSGVWLQEAVDNIFKMRDAAKAGQITDVEEARKVFESQIINQFIALINTLRTESVRTSRLTNQVRDLRGLFNDHVVPHIKPPAPVTDPVAAVRQITRVNLIPEFHIGGVSPREQIAKLLTDEMVLTVTQQRDIKALVGFDIFKAVGVPNAGQVRPGGMTQYHDGGRVAPALALLRPDKTEARAALQEPALRQLIEQIEVVRQLKVKGPRLASQGPELQKLLAATDILGLKGRALRQAINVNLIPQYHIGGISPREQLAKVLEDEMILTLKQQRDVIRRVGYNVFDVVGVPDSGKLGRDGLMRYHDGAQRVSAPLLSGPTLAVAPHVNAGAMVISTAPQAINLSVTLQVSQDQAGRLFLAGAKTADGRNVVVNIAQQAQERRKL